MSHFYAPGKTGPDVTLKKGPAKLQTFSCKKNRPIFYGTEEINTHRALCTTMPKGLHTYCHARVQQAAKEPAVFKKKAPPNWPKGRKR